MIPYRFLSLILAERIANSIYTNLKEKYDERFRIVFDAIRRLMSPSPVKRKQIGFRPTSRSQKR